MYKFWFESSPFDIGQTTKQAFSALLKYDETSMVENAYKHVTEFLNQSKSNGSLMRCTPTAVYCHLFEDRGMVRDVVSKDVQFTHSNQVVKDAVYLYCLAIGLLVKYGGEEARA
jgi:ADP-ribosyl-[dinitrogen reductase] hydrolase